MNGKPGDRPVNDICDHKLPVFSPTADDLVREIHQFLPRHRMWDLFDWFSPPPLAEFERQLEAKRDEPPASLSSVGGIHAHRGTHN